MGDLGERGISGSCPAAVVIDGLDDRGQWEGGGWGGTGFNSDVLGMANDGQLCDWWSWVLAGNGI